MKYPPLAEIIGNRRWQMHREPFPHVLAANVFAAPFHSSLRQTVQSIKARGLGEPGEPGKLSRNMTGYDAYGLSLNNETGVLGLFLSQAWHEMLRALFAVEATGHVNCGLHLHLPGSANGWIHNDLNPGWFVAGAERDDPVPADPGVCSYMRGTTTMPNLKSVETVRAVAMLYYIDNPPTSVGRGGATGLFESSRQRIDSPSAIVPARENSLLAFECTPTSFHAYLGGNENPRTCVILWLHRSREAVINRWGESSICGWSTSQDRQ